MDDELPVNYELSRLVRQHADVRPVEPMVCVGLGVGKSDVRNFRLHS